MHAATQRGSSIVELAIALPVLTFIVLAAVDFGRVYYVTNELMAAARAGAQYGGRDLTFSQDTTGIKNAAVAAAPNIGLVVADVTRNSPLTCYCASQTNPIRAANSTCAPCSTSTDHLVVYLTVTASRSFSTTSRYPGINSTFNLSRSATVRVQ